jgi:hypothetical protein
MKYYLVTRKDGKSGVQIFDDAATLNEAVLEWVNDGYKESDQALDSYYSNSGSKHFAVVQGIQLTTKVTSVEVG